MAARPWRLLTASMAGLRDRRLGEACNLAPPSVARAASVAVSSAMIRFSGRAALMVPLAVLCLSAARLRATRWDARDGAARAVFVLPRLDHAHERVRDRGRSRALRDPPALAGARGELRRHQPPGFLFGHRHRTRRAAPCAPAAAGPGHARSSGSDTRSRRYGGASTRRRRDREGWSGFASGLGPRLGLRLEATVDYVTTQTVASGNQWDIGAQVGLSIYAGRLGPRDADRDGVPDSEDRCAGTAAGLPVDPTGCPLPQRLGRRRRSRWDRPCPGTPVGQRVDQTGCNADLDGDGVPNALDRCPDTPPERTVDQFGCPPPARSRRFGRRRCPGRRGIAAREHRPAPPSMPSAAPCPSRRPPRARTTAHPARRDLHDRQRDPDRGAEASLRATAASLLLEPAVRLEVAGYTDDTGSRAVNERLSLASGPSRCGRSWWRRACRRTGSRRGVTGRPTRSRATPPPQGGRSTGGWSCGG